MTPNLHPGLARARGRVGGSSNYIGLGKALPQVDRKSINLDVSPNGPTDYIRTMFNLIVLALQTDTTRVAAYQICAEDGVGICDKFPTILGIGNRGHHQLTHTNGKRDWSHYDRYLAEQFAYFLDRLASIREGESRLLDNTMALFGSATSTTHNARNYPMILAGGKSATPFIRGITWTWR